MNAHFDALVSAYLDGELSEAETADLADRLRADPACARRFAELARLHDRLGNLFRTAPRAEPAPRPTRRGRAVVFSFGAVAAAALVLLALWVSPAPVSAASELDRLIASSADPRDRTYRIANLDGAPEPGDGRQPPIDGARLHVCSPDKYVLVRTFPDGRAFVTGSDGERSWSVPPTGAVRISGDPLRFRGPLPGHQQGLPFVDLRSDLVQFRDAYVVTALPPDATGRRGLLGEKKSPEFRGARRVELRYDAATGVIHRMEFDGMPRARGGPNRVAVELVEQRDLGPTFFTPEAHFAPGRRVIEEDQP